MKIEDDNLAYVQSKIRECLLKSTECPVEDDRHYWLKTLAYWQMELEECRKIKERDLKHVALIPEIDDKATKIAKILGLESGGPVYQQGTLYFDFVHGACECRVFCRDVEVIHGLLKEVTDERVSEAKRILNMYSINQEKLA